MLRAAISVGGGMAMLTVLLGRRGRGTPLDVALTLVAPLAVVVACVLTVELVLWLRRGRPRDGISVASSSGNLVCSAIVLWAVTAAGMSSWLSGVAIIAVAACVVSSALWLVLRWSLPERWSAPGHAASAAQRRAARSAAAARALAELPSDQRAAVMDRRERGIDALASMDLIGEDEAAWARSAPLGLLEEHMAVTPSERATAGSVVHEPALTLIEPTRTEPVPLDGSRRYRTSPRYWVLISALGAVAVAGVLIALLSPLPVAVLLGIVCTLAACVALAHPLRSLDTELAVHGDWLVIRGADQRMLVRAEVVRTAVEPGGDLLATIVHGRPGRQLTHVLLELEHGERVALSGFAAPLDETSRLADAVERWRGECEPDDA